MVKETWKQIPGYEGIYEVSSLGRIRSMDRIDLAGRRRIGRIRELQTSRRGGYHIVNLRRNNTTKSKKVHRLVALAFLGPPPKHKSDINHLNGVKIDNRPENLEYATREENVTHAAAMGLRGDHRGSKNGRARLNETQVEKILRLYSTGRGSITEIAKLFGVGKSTIGYIVQGVTWSHLSR